MFGHAPSFLKSILFYFRDFICLLICQRERDPKRREQQAVAGGEADGAGSSATRGSIPAPRDGDLSRRQMLA